MADPKPAPKIHPRKPIAPPAALGPLEQQFLTLYLHNMDPYRAYKETFPCEDLKLGSIKYRALQLLQSPIVQAEIARIRAPLYAAGTYTLQQHVAELEALRNLAVESGNLPVAAKMSELMGKASGHYVERSQQDINQNINQVTEIKIQFVDPPERA